MKITPAKRKRKPSIIPDSAKKKNSKTKKLRSSPTSAKPRKSSSFLALGSNLGGPLRQLKQALRALESLGRVVAVSSFYWTKPEGFSAQPDFLNAVVKLNTRLEPTALLRRIQEIERRQGRRPTFRNGPRVIDIDLLDVGGVVHRDRRLTLPHPRMHLRRFVLEPLAEIAPRWRHPKLRKTAARLLADLPV